MKVGDRVRHRYGWTGTITEDALEDADTLGHMWWVLKDGDICQTARWAANLTVINDTISIGGASQPMSTRAQYGGTRVDTTGLSPDEAEAFKAFHFFKATPEGHCACGILRAQCEYHR